MRIYDTSTLDDQLNTTIFVDSPTYVGNVYLIGVFRSGLFEGLCDDCDDIVTFDLLASKVFTLKPRSGQTN